MRLIFLTDNHANNAARSLGDSLKDDYSIDIFESDWSTVPADITGYDILLVSIIAGCDGNAQPGEELAQTVKHYLDAAKPLLILHGGSAAFPNHPWWRQLVGYRWVRKNDPAGQPASVHPIRRLEARLCDVAHPLASKLKPFTVETEEIYTQLEKTAPSVILMDCECDGRTWPQVYISKSQDGGRVAGFIPGHHASTLLMPSVQHNIRALVNYCVNGE